MPEIVYIVVNEAMPGLVKIGRTNANLAERVRGLNNTSVPLPFELFHASEVANSQFVENNLHEAFGDHRVSKTREFFRLLPERARAALLLAQIKEIKLGDEVYDSAEAKAEVEVAKRRSRFKLSMIGIKPGTTLKLAMDPNIVCTTIDESNKVEFNGEETSLSDAALQAVTKLGYEWPSASGPWEWTLDGKRLDEIRRSIEESAD